MIIFVKELNQHKKNKNDNIQKTKFEISNYEMNIDKYKSVHVAFSFFVYFLT